MCWFETNLPEGLVEGSRVSRHYFRAALGAAFVEDLVQDCLLLEAVDVAWSLWRYYDALLFADKAVVGRLRGLMLLARDGCRGTIVDLLQQIVLLLAHCLIAYRFLLPLLQLVFERLSVNTYTTVTDNLLSCVSCDRAPIGSCELSHS